MIALHVLVSCLLLPPVGWFVPSVAVYNQESNERIFMLMNLIS